MTLEEAIEILDAMPKHSDVSATENDKAALNLGIEALKRLKYLRDPSRCVGFKELPGETEG